MVDMSCFQTGKELVKFSTWKSLSSLGVMLVKGSYWLSKLAKFVDGKSS